MRKRVLSARVFLWSMLVLAAPLAAHAQSTAPENWWRIVTPATSGVQSKIDALPDAIVKGLKIPILIGIAPGSFKNNYGVVYSNGSTHQGEDIFAPRGAYVVSPTEAVVTRVDFAGAGGIAVYTANPGKETFYYAHLTAVGPTIHVGAQLDPGDLIGYVGNTGDAEGASTHLHFQIFEYTDDENDIAGGVIDPNPRLTEAFSKDEQIDALQKIIDRSDNPALAAQAIARLYKSFLTSLAADDHTLPSELTDALAGTMPTSTPVSTPTPPPPAVSTPPPTPVTTPATPDATPAVSSVTPVVTPAPSANIPSPASSTPSASKGGLSSDLMLGMRTDEVKVLQAYIIKQKAGIYAKTLATYGATGYYGVLTKAAVIEFQRSVGITGSGMAGPITRAYIAAHA